MNTLYLDLFSGVSGDMFIGGLIDVGVDAHALEHELEKLGAGGYHIHVRRGEKRGIAGTKFDVHLDAEHGDGHHHHHEHEHTHTHEHHGDHSHHHEHGHGHSHAHQHSHEHEQTHDHEHEHEHGNEHSHDESRDFAQIQELITESSLSAWVKARAISVFRRIAVAEGKIHGVAPDKVHFHEVGAVDSIVDIIGACVALEMLGKPRVLASAVTEGSGWVNCAHGRFPIPAPATLEILGVAGIPLTQSDEPHELVTPTGAAILAEFVEEFGPMRNLVAKKTGYGLGTRDNKTRPNVLRVVLGDADPAAAGGLDRDTVAVLETNIDDASAEVLGFFMEKALQAGALDVFHTPICMKKNRPATLLTVLCGEEKADFFTELMLTETTAFGVRRHVAERRKLARECVQVETPFGKVTVKLGLLNGRTVQAAPEYESVKAIAEGARVPFKEVYAAAVRACAPNPIAKS